MAFHINPKTGNTGICKAENGKCPFGSADEHFATRNEARASYEKKQESFEHFHWKSKMPATKGAYTLAVYDPMSEEIGVKELWGNPVFGKFAERMDKAEDKTRLVIENGQVWEKNALYGDQTWKFVSGDYDSLTRLERGRSYDRSYLGTPIMTHGARLENGGGTPKMAPEHRAGVYPDSDEVKYEAGIVSTVFTEADGAYEAQDVESHLDDYVSERWHELTPQHWATIGSNLRKELGEPINLGEDDNPSWVWSKSKR